MNKKEIEQLKQALHDQLKNLRGNALTNGESGYSLPDINDQASYESQRSFDLRIRDRERKLISKVKESLEKIEAGTYGVCESCGEPIGIKRLLARPMTTLCLQCKVEQERDEKHRDTERSDSVGIFS